MTPSSVSVGGVVKYNYEQVNLSDGLFEVLMIRTPRSLTDLQELLTDISNRNYAECPHILYQKAKNVLVESEQPIAWTLDGEAGGEHTSIRIRNCRHAVNILTPKERENA